MKQYKKKPVIVNAVQFFYDDPELDCVTYPPKSADGRTYIGDAYVTTIHGDNISIFNGDWIIEEPDREHYYLCKPEIFDATYEPVGDDSIEE